MTHDTTSVHAPRARLAFLLLGVLVGMLVLLAVRFVTYAPEKTHYHANFGIFINGEREKFVSPQYYEEVKICDLGGNSPQSRTHMHNQENGIVHVHDKAVTWGAFFENLGWMVGPEFIRTKDTLLVADDANKLNIVLNGEDLTGITEITNQTISDKDRLLVSFGPSDPTTLDKQYKSIASDAGKYNSAKDPGQCGGSNIPTFRDRITHLF